MKKLFLTLLFALIFIGCEKLEIKPQFFMGEWTTYLPTDKQKTDSLNLRICFSIFSGANVYYTYRLYDFDLDYNDSTIFYKVYLDSLSNIKYYGKYNEEKNMFIGNSYYYDKIGSDKYPIFMHENVITKRGMTLF